MMPLANTGRIGGMDGCYSGEVDVVAEARFACLFEQPQQRRSFFRACLAPDDDDDATMWLGLGELEAVVTIACHQEAFALVRKLEDRWITRIMWEDVAQADDLMVQFSEQVREILGHVLVEQERHR